MSDRLKIGEIRYANCTPIYSTLKGRADLSGYEFITGEPATLNRMLASGAVDVSSSSSIEYARHQDEYLIIPGISISSTGPVGSILLFSKVRVEKLAGRSIAMSSASATSTVLLKILLRKHYRMETRFETHHPDLKIMLAENDAALIIGDEALKERIAVKGSELYVYDLGEIWNAYAGLPFVYALWMVRRDSAARLPELAARFKTDILEARMAAAMEYPAIAKKSAESGWMGESELVGYWEAMSYALDNTHIEGLTRFFAEAHELGECPALGSLDFL